MIVLDKYFIQYFQHNNKIVNKQILQIRLRSTPHMCLDTFQYPTPYLLKHSTFQSILQHTHVSIKQVFNYIGYHFTKHTVVCYRLFL